MITEVVATEIKAAGLQARAAYGLRRTNKDKRCCVLLALSAFSERSNRWIAEMCGVSHTLVEEIRQVEESLSCNKRLKTRTGKDGKQHPAKKEQINERKRTR